MVATVTSRSKARQIDNISVGYGQVPEVYVNGKKGWGLPNREVTFCRDTALQAAKQLNDLIRSSLDSNATKLK